MKNINTVLEVCPKDLLQEVPSPVSSFDTPTSAPARQQGTLVNLLYSQYASASPDSPEKERAESELFSEITNYCQLLIWKKFSDLRKNGSDDDCVQISVLKILEKIPSFSASADMSSYKPKEHLSDCEQALAREKFSQGRDFAGWVRTLCINTVKDFLRSKKARREQSFPDGKAISHAGQFRHGNDENRDEQDSTDEGSCVIERREILSKPEMHAAQTALNMEHDLASVIARLSPLDRLIVSLLRDGYSSGSKEMQEQTGLSKKQVYNRWARLKPVLKDELTGLPVCVHTCMPSAIPTNDLNPLRQYVSDGSGSYQELPECRCKKIITKRESRESIERGEAQEVYKIINDKPVINVERIWCRRLVRIQRVTAGLQSAQIERAVAGNQQDISDREIGHQMDLEFRARLIITDAEKIRRGISDCYEKDESRGRAIFTSFQERRSKGGYEYSEDSKQLAGILKRARQTEWTPPDAGLLPIPAGPHFVVRTSDCSPGLHLIGISRNSEDTSDSGE